MRRTGGKILVDALRINGADLAFGVPGESYAAVLDALRDTPALRYVVCRQEGGAAYMAEAYGKLTGRPGVCFVARGPGAANAAIGVHTARQDSTPMVLLVGDVRRTVRDREASQELDIRGMLAPLAKWSTVVDDAARLPEFVARAFSDAVSGRPGPVVLGLPEDMLADEVEIADAPSFGVIQGNPGTAQLKELRRILDRARRPVMILGGGWTPAGVADITAFAESWRLPTATAFRHQDLIDNSSPLHIGYVGLGMNPKLAARIRNADVLLVVGARLGEATTLGYSLIEAPRPRQTLIHVHQGAEELGRVYAADLPIVSGLREYAAAARKLEPGGGHWSAWAASARADYEEDSRHVHSASDFVDLGSVVVHLRETLPRDAIVTTGSGNFNFWVQRYYRFSQYPTQLGPTSGAMGYGVPAGIAAKLVRPERVVVCICGDGDFLMNGQELATAMTYGVSLVILVVNNGMYGTIRMWQERLYPGRVYGTDLVNPDFAAYARAFGAGGELVETTDDFPQAFRRALSCGRPALLELRVDPNAITSRTSIDQLRSMPHAPT